MTSKLFASVRLFRGAAVLSFAGSLACGSVSGETGTDSTLATLHGTIVQPESAVPTTNLATALVWYAQAGAATYVAAQSAHVSATFPAAFTLTIDQPPPPSMLTDLNALTGAPQPTGIHVATGQLVAYEDLNDDGQLDLVSSTSAHYTDQVVGWTEAQDRIFYFEQPLPSGLATALKGADGSIPQAGYNLETVQPNVCVGADATAKCGPATAWKSLDTPITLTLGAADAAQSAEMNLTMCAENAVTHIAGGACTGSGSSGGSASCVEPVTAFPGPLPAPNDPNLVCQSTTTFVYQQNCTATVENVCEIDVACDAITVSLDAPGSPTAAAPSGWPCAAQSGQ